MATIDSSCFIYNNYVSNIFSPHSLCSHCERSPLCEHHVPLQSQKVITVLSLRLIMQKILIFLTSAIMRHLVWRAKQMSEIREFLDDGRDRSVRVLPIIFPHCWLHSDALQRSQMWQPERKKERKQSVLARLPLAKSFWEASAFSALVPGHL